MFDRDTVNTIISLKDRIGTFFSVQGGHFVFYVLTLGTIAFGLASVEICRLNGRAAMREIYLTDGTSEQVTEVKLLLAVTLLAITTFLPRLAGLRH